MNTSRIIEAYGKLSCVVDVYSEDELKWITNQRDINPNVMEYLMHCLPLESIHITEIDLFGLSWIRYAAKRCDPYGHMFMAGFLPMAGTTTGNAFYLDIEKDGVYFAEIDQIMTHRDVVSCYKDEDMVDFKGITPENIRKALYLVTETIEEFLLGLLDGNIYEDIVEKIDK